MAFLDTELRRLSAQYLNTGTRMQSSSAFICALSGRREIHREKGQSHMMCLRRSWSCGMRRWLWKTTSRRSTVPAYIVMAYIVMAEDVVVEDNHPSRHCADNQTQQYPREWVANRRRTIGARQLAHPSMLWFTTEANSPKRPRPGRRGSPVIASICRAQSVECRSSVAERSDFSGCSTASSFSVNTSLIPAQQCLEII